MNQIVKKLLDETAGRKDRGIVCLIGPPQWGKTHTIMTWAGENGYEVVRLLAQTMEPEAICGYDVKHPQTGELTWAPPSWFRTILAQPKKKWLIFLDELDKAREASQTALLTLLCDRMVQNKELPASTMIASAMNVPRAPLPPALVERMLFVQFPSKDDDLVGGIKTLKSIAKEYLELPKVQFPERIKNKGTMHRLESWTTCKDFWSDENLRHAIIVGLVPAKDVPWTINKMDPKAFMGIDPIKWAENARPSDLNNSLVDLLNSEKNQQTRYEIFKVICERANQDPTGELAQALSKVAEKMHEVKG